MTALDLSGNGIGDLGAEALAASPALAALVELHLRDNRIGESGAQALAEAPHLKRLAVLDLRANPIDRRRRASRALQARFGDRVIRLGPVPRIGGGKKIY